MLKTMFPREGAQGGLFGVENRDFRKYAYACILGKTNYEQRKPLLDNNLRREHTTILEGNTKGVHRKSLFCGYLQLYIYSAHSILGLVQ